MSRKEFDYKGYHIRVQSNGMWIATTEEKCLMGKPVDSEEEITKEIDKWIKNEERDKEAIHKLGSLHDEEFLFFFHQGDEQSKNLFSDRPEIEYIGIDPEEEFVARRKVPVKVLNWTILEDGECVAKCLRDGEMGELIKEPISEKYLNQIKHT